MINENNMKPKELDIDLEWLGASAEMYNEHCIQVIGAALRNQNPFMDHFYDPNWKD